MCIIYRPPNSKIPDFITELSDLIYSGVLGSRYVICGDLNCPGPSGTYGLVGEELRELIDEHNLTQHVNTATCRSGNLLDHILTPTNTVPVKNVNVRDVGISDHSLVTCTMEEK